MEIEFVWHTRKLESYHKEELEKEIKKKVSDRLEKLAEMKIGALSVFLYDDKKTGDFVATGDVFLVENRVKKAIISKIEIGRGFLIQCEKNSWFQPR